MCPLLESFVDAAREAICEAISPTATRKGTRSTFILTPFRTPWTSYTSSSSTSSSPAASWRCRHCRNDAGGSAIPVRHERCRCSIECRDVMVSACIVLGAYRGFSTWPRGRLSMGRVVDILSSTQPLFIRDSKNAQTA